MRVECRVIAFMNMKLTSHLLFHFTGLVERLRAAVSASFICCLHRAVIYCHIFQMTFIGIPWSSANNATPITCTGLRHAGTNILSLLLHYVSRIHSNFICPLYGRCRISHLLAHLPVIEWLYWRQIGAKVKRVWNIYDIGSNNKTKEVLAVLLIFFSG